MHKPSHNIAWIILLSMWACTAEEPVERKMAAHEVAFSAYTGQYLTRGNAPQEVQRAIPDGGSMGVYAYLHDNSTWVADAAASRTKPNFMWNQQATYRQDYDAFVYTPLKYWPNEEGDKVSFIAYYPYSAESPGHPDSPAYPDNASGVKTLLANDGTQLPTFELTVKDAPAQQVDFLVSDLITNLPESRDTEGDPHTEFHDLSIYDHVKFLFHHAMAKVEFRVVTDPDIRKDLVSFSIKSPGITLTNIKKKGTLTPTYTPLTGTSLTWVPDDDAKQDYTFKTYEPQLLLPQPLANEAKFCMSYEMTFKSDGTSYHYEGSTPVADQAYTYSCDGAELQLNELCLAGTSTPLTTWLPNHHYIYTIRLRAHRIEFTAQVVEWGQELPWTVDVDSE